MKICYKINNNQEWRLAPVCFHEILPHLAISITLCLNCRSITMKKILAFSSSRAGNGGFLQTVVPVVSSFLGKQPSEIVFLPFASVKNDYGDYTNVVRQAFDGTQFNISGATRADAKSQLENADVIMVGGGNTFKLLHHLYAHGLLDLVKKKVDEGTPYVGWSAGANITGPTIGTTNDMPIIEPPGFRSFGFFPFQLNPHYANFKLAGHNGESRDDRLEEYAIMNPGTRIIGLPEGSVLKLEGKQLTYVGSEPAVIFHTEAGDTAVRRREVPGDEDLSFLL
jgi:dipeptidase E